MQLLHVEDGYDYTAPPEFNPEQSTLEKVKDNLCTMVYFAAALDKKITRMAISYTAYVYRLLKDKGFTVSSNLNGQDVIGDAADVVKDVHDHRHAVLKSTVERGKD